MHRAQLRTGRPSYIWGAERGRVQPVCTGCTELLPHDDAPLPWAAQPVLAGSEQGASGARCPALRGSRCSRADLVFKVETRAVPSGLASGCWAAATGVLAAASSGWWPSPADRQAGAACSWPWQTGVPFSQLLNQPVQHTTQKCLSCGAPPAVLCVCQGRGAHVAGRALVGAALREVQPGDRALAACQQLRRQPGLECSALHRSQTKSWAAPAPAEEGSCWTAWTPVGRQASVLLPATRQDASSRSQGLHGARAPGQPRFSSRRQPSPTICPICWLGPGPGRRGWRIACWPQLGWLAAASCCRGSSPKPMAAADASWLAPPLPATPPGLPWC